MISPLWFFVVDRLGFFEDRLLRPSQHVVIGQEMALWSHDPSRPDTNQLSFKFFWHYSGRPRYRRIRGFFSKGKFTIFISSKYERSFRSLGADLRYPNKLT